MRTTAVAIAIVAAGCGGVTAATQNAVIGSVYDPSTASSRGFAAKDGIVTTQTAKGFAINGPAAYVEITDFSGTCAAEVNASTTAAYYPNTGQTLTLGMAVNDSTGAASAPTRPGTFTIPQQTFTAPNQSIAVAYYMGGCMKYDAQSGVSGTVTLSNVAADGTMDGSFDVVLTCGSTCAGHEAHLAGFFHATPCAAFSVNRNSMCQ